MLFAGLYGMRRRAARAAAERIAADLCLDDVLDRRLGTLSGGQQRRVQAATAMIHRPPALVLDEPTVGADPLTRERCCGPCGRPTMAPQSSTRRTTCRARRLGATLAVADRGRVIARGERAELRAALPAPDASLDQVYASW
jgi:ABC-2 type transport system ATP-binding protein